MVNSIYDVAPKLMVDELRRMMKVESDWLEVSNQRPKTETYSARSVVGTFLRSTWREGCDAFSTFALSKWLEYGPKIFRPTLEQCRAMEQVEANVELEHYAQPYSALLIDLPKGYEPFRAVLCHHLQKNSTLTLVSFSEGNLHDVTTTIGINGRPIEVALQTYDDDCAEHAKVCALGLRIAINSCLALVNYGTCKELLFRKATENDRLLASEQSERGVRARIRLKDTVYLVSFAQEVKLHDTHGDASTGEGSEIAPHWRRGHWRRQHYGSRNGLVKNVLIKPVLVRADKFIGDLADTSSTYRS